MQSTLTLKFETHPSLLGLGIGASLRLRDEKAKTKYKIYTRYTITAITHDGVTVKKAVA